MTSNKIAYKGQSLPRLPLDGNFDLTYRCNNLCRHCWLWRPDNTAEREEELSFEEICRIVNEARQMGCQAWHISGGEPMLRTDFSEIFDYITKKSITYTLNTNGTLITPEIASLMTRKGRKMVAIYGATAEIHDHITRNPGSFEATMRGFAYLIEAGAKFEVQIIPMRDNYHQREEMVQLALTLSPIYRFGATWLWLSSCHSHTRNKEIAAQRLDPTEVVDLNEPIPHSTQTHGLPIDDEITVGQPSSHSDNDNRLFGACIATKRSFHIDPYGKMSFCLFIKDPALRYDLRKGSFRQAWDEFIPSIADIVHDEQEYYDNCGSCDLRQDCQWCAVYSFLEHGRYSARIDYLCQVTNETHRFKENWKLKHLRYYQIAGITVQVSANFPLEDDLFISKFENFRITDPSPELIAIKFASPVPKLSELKLGHEIQNKPPWQIYRMLDESWVYAIKSQSGKAKEPHTLAIINKDCSQITIYREKNFKWKNLHSLTTFSSDQILLAKALANYQACFFHSSGIIINGLGFLFVGHSGMGKSTMMKMLRDHGEVLCDDRNIVRCWPDGFRVHGTWSHGELPEVSPSDAPLRAILILEQAKTNELIPITNKQEQLGELLSHVVKALVNEDWWEKTLSLVGKMTADVPIYRMKFDKSGKIIDNLNPLFE